MKVTWKIEWLKTTSDQAYPPKYVLNAGWICTVEEGDVKEIAQSSCTFEQTINEDGSFTPFESLTEEQVLGWCWNNGVDRPGIELRLTTKVNDIVNPPIIQPPLPWA